MKLSLYFEAARPKTLIAGISPVLIGSVIAKNYVGFDFYVFLNILITAIFIQIGTNLANDYFDAKKGSDSTDRVGPRRIMQQGLVRDHTMIRAIFVTFLFAAMSTVYLISVAGPLVVYLFLLAILLAIGYTAGPFALAYIGLGDLFVFFFFGPFATLITTYLFTKQFLLDAFLAGIGPGLLSAAILTTNNLRDYSSDMKSAKRTLIVRFGRTYGKWQYTTCTFLAFLIPPILFNLFHYNSLILLTNLISIFGLLIARDVWTAEKSEDYIPLLPKTAKLLLFYTLLFCLGCLK
jgi:1,4-dihydroxy-2-naphthoate octaprenyltransferase